MAKQGFGRFKWSPGGYRAVQNSGAVQRILQREADSRAGAANARTVAHDHESTDHFAVKPVQGKFARGYVVHPVTDEGYAHARRGALGE